MVEVAAHQTGNGRHTLQKDGTSYVVVSEVQIAALEEEIHNA